MSKKAFWVSLGLIMTIVAAMTIAAVRFRQEVPWDVSYEMANSRIEWSGAGYNGIYD